MSALSITATAAMHVIARRLADGEIVEPRHALQALRRMFAPGRVWGGLNLLIVGVVVGNFRLYQSATGWLWASLRLAWGVIALSWFAVNLFYWPFWLAQSERRLGLGLRNSLLFYLKTPALGLTLLLLAAALAAVSVLSTLPLAAGLMAWLALIGVLAVEAELKAERAMATGLVRREA